MKRLFLAFFLLWTCSMVLTAQQYQFKKYKVEEGLISNETYDILQDRNNRIWISTKFIVFSFHKEIEYISQAKVLQINGYLLKEDSFAEIENCIAKVLNDEICFSPSVAPASLASVSEDFKKE